MAAALLVLPVVVIGIGYKAFFSKKPEKETDKAPSTPPTTITSISLNTPRAPSTSDKRREAFSSSSSSPQQYHDASLFQPQTSYMDSHRSNAYPVPVGEQALSPGFILSSYSSPTTRTRPVPRASSSSSSSRHVDAGSLSSSSSQQRKPLTLDNIKDTNMSDTKIRFALQNIGNLLQSQREYKDVAAQLLCAAFKKEYKGSWVCVVGKEYTLTSSEDSLKDYIIVRAGGEEVILYRYR